ncbi:MAG: hypothetical protein Q4D80_00355 [Pseudomonadota bacterium]|nr:hypothetical protein [Pseudomonadota bacterium]
MKKRKNNPVYVTLPEAQDKDFHVRVIENERLIPSVQLRDADFEEDMYNFGEADDLPESDRLMVCQRKGVKQTRCERP